MKVVTLGRKKTEAAKSKTETATALAGLGGAIGSVFSPVGGAIGAGVGAIGGLIIGDNKTIFPIDMVAIPAYQAYMLNGTPSMTIYIKAGETLVPTGGNVLDMQENMSVEAVAVADKPKRTRKPSKYNQIYSKHFKAAQNRPDYKKKDGTWKKNGFKRAVKAAHKKTKLEMK